MKLHQKGWLLVQLRERGACWDRELVDAALAEYGGQGVRARGTIRVALDELAAGGLVLRSDQRLWRDDGRDRLSFCYTLSDFGRQRMRDTGLWDESAEAAR